jgi:hypothetical protein
VSTNAGWSGGQGRRRVEGNDLDARAVGRDHLRRPASKARGVATLQPDDAGRAGRLALQSQAQAVPRDDGDRGRVRGKIASSRNPSRSVKNASVSWISPEGSTTSADSIGFEWPLSMVRDPPELQTARRRARAPVRRLSTIAARAVKLLLTRGSN